LNGYPGGDNPALASLLVTVESPTAVTVGHLAARPAAPNQAAVPTSVPLLALASLLAAAVTLTLRRPTNTKSR
jgi:hypothetical protein